MLACSQTLTALQKQCPLFCSRNFSRSIHNRSGFWFRFEKNLIYHFVMTKWKAARFFVLRQSNPAKSQSAGPELHWGQRACEHLRWPVPHQHLRRKAPLRVLKANIQGNNSTSFQSKSSECRFPNSLSLVCKVTLSGSAAGAVQGAQNTERRGHGQPLLQLELSCSSLPHSGQGFTKPSSAQPQ